MDEEDVGEGALASILGVGCGDVQLYRTALSHGSLAGVNYERLEFLGDRVVALAVAAWLAEAFPGENEGQHAKRWNVLVSGKMLAEMADDSGLSALICHAAPELTMSMKADVFEAVMGAVFWDHDFETAASFIRGVVAAKMPPDSPVPEDAKSALQEWTMARGLELPAYALVGDVEAAPPFTCEVSVEGYPAVSGYGPTKKDAQREAAGRWLSLHREGAP